MSLAGTTRINKKIILIAGLVIVALGLSIFIWQRNNTPTFQADKQAQKFKNNSISSQIDTANKKVDQKNYNEAINSYIVAASLKSSNGDYADAESDLLDAEKKIPADKLTWDFYDTLAYIANKQHHDDVEKDSLQKALTKAQQPGSGSTAKVIDRYKARLGELGVSI